MTEKTREYNREWKRRKYQERKQNNLCVECGKAPPVNGKTKCQSCIDKRQKYRQESRDFYRRFGICPECHQFIIMGDENICPECKAKKDESRERSVSHVDTEKRKKYQKEYYRHCKEKGICPSCGRRTLYGKVRCPICLDKNATYARLKGDVMHGKG